MSNSPTVGFIGAGKMASAIASGICRGETTSSLPICFYDPLPEAETLQDQMKAWRQRAGLSATAAAKFLGVGKATWAAWERGAMTPSAESREAIEKLMNHVELP